MLVPQGSGIPWAGYISISYSNVCNRCVQEAMKQSEIYLQNAENCAYLAEGARDEPTRQRYKRMEAAWTALADEQDWLDGEPSPVRQGEG